LSASDDDNLLVGFDTHDDAGVYRLSDEQALVVTTDIITPPTDDPETFGRVAAANALSDVYAMGGTPLTCLNIMAFPADKLGGEVMAGIVTGAAEKIAEAGAVLAGGHTIDDPEPKFGLAVTGTVHPDSIWRNSTAKAGDVLILTKPIGSGVILNANLKGWVSVADLEACLEVLVTLNRTAAVVAGAFPVTAATDITGFGLGCHALEMARGAGVCLRFDFPAIEVLGGALAMYERGMTTGSNLANRQMVADSVVFTAPRTASEQELIFDPQTNGGLLLAVRADAADALVIRLRDAGVEAANRVGTVVDAEGRARVEFSG
jgi:selenide,water dikinase